MILSTPDPNFYNFWEFFAFSLNIQVPVVLDKHTPHVHTQPKPYKVPEIIETHHEEHGSSGDFGGHDFSSSGSSGEGLSGGYESHGWH